MPPLRSPSHGLGRAQVKSLLCAPALVSTMTHPELIERITRSLAYMLRHQPDQFDLELDEFGFANLEDVVQALNERLGEPVEVEDVRFAVESGDRLRYEIADGQIRALYGHSIDVKAGEPSKPPERLYVGVSRHDAERALRYGLRPGRRRYLHLALSADEARDTAQRTADDVAVLAIHALDAWEEGINFYDRGALFLSDPIPTQYLESEGGREPQRELRAPDAARRAPPGRPERAEGFASEAAGEDEFAPSEGGEADAGAPRDEAPREFGGGDAGGPRRRRRRGRRGGRGGEGGGFDRGPRPEQGPAGEPAHGAEHEHAGEEAPHHHEAPFEGEAEPAHAAERGYDDRPHGNPGGRGGHGRRSEGGGGGGGRGPRHGGGRDERREGGRPPERSDRAPERVGAWGSGGGRDDRGPDPGRREYSDAPRGRHDAPRHGGDRPHYGDRAPQGGGGRGGGRGPERGSSERAPSERSGYDRPHYDRPHADRAPSDRPHYDRPHADRGPHDRPPQERHEGGGRERGFHDRPPRREFDERPPRHEGGGRPPQQREAAQHDEGGFGHGLDSAARDQAPRRAAPPPPPPVAPAPPPPVRREPTPARRDDDDGGSFGAGL